MGLILTATEEGHTHVPHNGLISPVHVWAIPQRIAASWLRCYSGGRGLIPLPTPFLLSIVVGSNQLRAAVVLTSVLIEPNLSVKFSYLLRVPCVQKKALYVVNEQRTFTVQYKSQVLLRYTYVNMASPPRP